MSKSQNDHAQDIGAPATFSWLVLRPACASWILALLLLLALPAAMQAQFDYATTNDTITITKYTGSGGVVDLPSMIDGLPVTCIGGGAFDSCSNLTCVTMPDSITRIGDTAFLNCTNLTNVTLPNSLLTIGINAFRGCPLTEVTLPNSVISIGKSAFFFCKSLVSVTIPTNITSVEDYTFFACSSLTNVTIPDSVTNIGPLAFAYTGLIRVTIPNNVTRIGDSFSGCGHLTDLRIGNGVTSIDVNAFQSCGGLTSLTIPNGLTTIGNLAFQCCTNLTRVTIPESVTNIGAGAFFLCTRLTSVYFKGNAPGGDSDPNMFYRTDDLTVYYLPGKTGWGLTFGGRPARLWDPQVQASSANFGVRTNRFGFTISGTTGLPLVVEACTNLANPVWIPVGTNTLTGSYFTDLQWTNYPNRFYRLRSP